MSDTELIFGSEIDMTLGFGKGSSTVFDYVTNTSLLASILEASYYSDSSWNESGDDTDINYSEITMDCYDYDRIRIDIDFSRRLGWYLTYFELTWVQNTENYIPYYTTNDIYSNVYTFLRYFRPFDPSNRSYDLPYTFVNEQIGNYTFTSMIFQLDSSISQVNESYDISELALEITFETSSVSTRNTHSIGFQSLSIEIEPFDTMQPTMSPTPAPTPAPNSVTFGNIAVLYMITLYHRVPVFFLSLFCLLLSFWLFLSFSN